ncbi:AMP-binding protein [Clostridium brassicae]|uniref:AMP-binding protein n=1 Tax=Clostridium brassicae TaxID=2999072 RepID=A0ABT4D5R5_9CLOT|nr:AMP-binding protein [Clostridium brassicae]MCY6957632.1 AMP-binding protein [Clostridium brassicae]
MVANMVGSKTLKSQWNETVSYYRDRTFLKYISVNDEVNCFTYHEFDCKVKQAANVFLALGIRKQDLVALHLHNKPEYLICWLALAQIGAVSVPINEHFQIDECRYIIKKCDISRVITEPRCLNIYTEHYNELKLDTLILTDGFSEDSRVHMLEKEMALQSVSLNEQVSVSTEETAVILFTSGTTKHPKGAIYTHCNVIYGGLFHCAQIGMRTEDIFLTSMPCYHMDFQEMAATPVICAGATLVMVEHYSAHRFWRQICENKATYTDTMSILNRTMMLQPVQPWEKNHHLKEIYFSMGLSREEKEAFEERFNVRLLNSYGMTETVSAVTCVPLYGDQHWPSVGRPAISYEIKIIDENGNTLPACSEGEICVHGIPGCSIIPGYYKDEEATKLLIDKDGWLHSGDWGYLDDDGWLFFLCRCGDMIKRSGENISCVEIECVLTSHPMIMDAAVVGVPDSIRDKAVKAFVKLIDGATLTEDEIILYCKDRLACFKVPEFVAFVKDFPRTATGKIKKRELIEADKQ